MRLPDDTFSILFDLFYETLTVCVCIEVLRPSQSSRVMSSVISLPNYTFTGQT